MELVGPQAETIYWLLPSTCANAHSSTTKEQVIPTDQIFFWPTVNTPAYILEFCSQVPNSGRYNSFTSFHHNSLAKSCSRPWNNTGLFISQQPTAVQTILKYLSLCQHITLIISEFKTAWLHGIGGTTSSIHLLTAAHPMCKPRSLSIAPPKGNKSSQLIQYSFSLH